MQVIVELKHACMPPFPYKRFLYPLITPCKCLCIINLVIPGAKIPPFDLNAVDS